jgi:hypothetical protein
MSPLHDTQSGIYYGQFAWGTHERADMVTPSVRHGHEFPPGPTGRAKDHGAHAAWPTMRAMRSARSPLRRKVEAK